MAQMKVFISHSHTNNDFCEELVKGLKAAGADVWYDNESLHSGQLGPVIERELRDRPVFLVVLSPAALQSRWVEDETRWAYNRLRRDPTRILLPILAELLPDEDDIWLFLQDFKRVEASGNRPFSPAEAVSRTLRALQLTRPGEPPQIAAPQSDESAADLVARGKALTAQKKHAEALPLFQRATKLDLRSFDVWANLGRTFEELGRWQEGLEAGDRAVALDDKRAWGWSLRSAALNGLKRYDEALASIDKALTLDPNDALEWARKGETLLGLSRYEEALVALDSALAIDPNTALAWSNKGAALNALNRYEEALVAHDRALALDPTNVIAWYNQGNALENLKRYAEALVAYECGFDPNDSRDWDGKARCLRALGRIAEAEEAERRAKALGG